MKQIACLLILAAAIATAVALSSKAPPIITPTPAYCSIKEGGEVTADGTQEWPEGFLAPCKWFKREADV